jgi:hypothetical protein
MKKRIEAIVVVFTLALSVFAFKVPMVFAETMTETTPTETITPVEVTLPTEVTEPSETSGETTTEPDTSSDLGTTENTESELPPVLDENGEVVSPGTLPDSPFYWLTTLIEKLQVMLTTDPVQKTELLEEQALERLSEAQVMVQNGETEEAEATLQAYSGKLAEAQAFLVTLTETDSETLQKLETALGMSHANNIQTLGGLLDKLPPQAAQKVALNVVRSMEKSIAKMEKKDQLKVAKELKKATKGLEENELADEDQAALENLDETLDLAEGDVEESVIANSDIKLSSMALTTDSLALSTKPLAQVEGSKVSRQSPSQDKKYREAESNVSAGEVQLSEQNKGLEARTEQQEKAQQVAKEQEQKKLEEQGQLKAEEGKELKDKSVNAKNSAEKHNDKKAK